MSGGCDRDPVLDPIRDEPDVCKLTALERAAAAYAKACCDVAGARERLLAAEKAQAEALEALGRMSGIYVASKAKHGRFWQRLRASGLPIISTWIYESEDGQTSDWAGLWVRAIREASTASVVIVYNLPGECMKGALVEVGAALAHGVPVLWVGPMDGYTVAQHPLVTECSCLEIALELARKMAGAS